MTNPPFDEAGTTDAPIDDESLGEEESADDDMYLGGEAALPPGEYGTKHAGWTMLSEGATAWNELNRRVNALGTPAFPLDVRRVLGWNNVSAAWRALAMRGRSSVVDDFGRDPQATARWERRLEWLYRHYFRVAVTGMEHVPATGPAILVANHGGLLPLDSVLLMHAIRREHPAGRDARPLIEDEFFHMPFIGSRLAAMGAVRAHPQNGERLLRRGELVVVFPEGVKGTEKTWRQRYQLARFGRGGFVRLAMRMGVPVLPVAIVGSDDANPQLFRINALQNIFGGPSIPVTPTFPLLGPLGLLPLPTSWRIAIGEPITMPAAAADDRIFVSRMTDTIRKKLQAQLDALVTRL
ncbi:MAG: acyltransferase family protein [Myxococcales bacterium]|nr:acyltransferase family protein [Myxococcales bacterium]